MPAYRDSEFLVIQMFNSAPLLVWNGVTYTEIKASKPTPPSGECKTDVYVSLRQNGIEKDSIKISVKQSNADFLANKLKAIDAENLLGNGWETILVNSIRPIRDNFLRESLVQIGEVKGVPELYIKLGWKLEITNKARNLSAPLNLPVSQIIDYIYRGTNQPIARLNAYVDGVQVVNSGVADYILYASDFQSIQDLLDNLTPLHPSTFTPPPTFLAFTANNYRLVRNTADGPRTLAVNIEWQLNDDNKLFPVFNFDQPLAFTGQGQMMPILLNNLATLGVRPDDFDTSNIRSFRVHDFFLV